MLLLYNTNILYIDIMDNTCSSLETLAIKYGLDKCLYSGCHNYIPGYTKLFCNIKQDVENILEIGIGSLENGQMGGVNGYLANKTKYKTGNSLKCWEEYFPNANIYGIDMYSHQELNNNRIKTFVADQYNADDLKNVMIAINKKLDIIIDDGSHKGEHQVFSFIYLNNYLNKNGIYVIEDIQPENIDKFKDLSIFPKNIKEYITSNFEVVQFDTRTTIGRIDDFMMAFKKI